MVAVNVTDELAALAAEFTGWHIWRGRSASGRPTDWNATGKHRVNGKCPRLTAPDAAGLRDLLAREKALVAA
jgi:hypothetical protein